MTILLTGGAGFIGSACLKRLLIEGHEVVVLDNLDSTLYSRRLKEEQLAWARRAGSFEFVEGDVRDGTMLGGIFDRHEISHVLHLAGVAGVRLSVEQPSLFYDINVTGTATVLEVARAHGVASFLLASSSSVYGARHEVPFREDEPVDAPESPYAASKHALEMLARTHHKLHGGDVTCLRFFTVYGPRQRPQMAIHKFMRHMAEGEPVPMYGDGTSGRDYTYIDDVVDGVMRAMRRLDGFRLYNLGGARVVRLRDLIDSIARTLGVDTAIQRLPRQPGDVEVTSADISKARRELGYEPQTELEGGLKKMWEWYRDWTDVESTIVNARRGAARESEPGLA